MHPSIMGDRSAYHGSLNFECIFDTKIAGTSKINAMVS